jgi:hypothetical protein
MAQDLVSPSLYPTAADLALLDGSKLFTNHVAIVSRISATIPVTAKYRWIAASTSPDNNQSQLVIVPGTSPASGKWVRWDPCFDLVIPATFANTDNQSMVVVPAEMTLQPHPNIILEVTTVWAGGAASTIGLSFSTPSLNRARGNLAGGAAGNSGFTSTFFAAMTLGSQFAGGLAQAVILPPASIIAYDRITSAFTSGAGNFHLPCFRYATTITPVAPP